LMQFSKKINSLISQYFRISVIRFSWKCKVFSVVWFWCIMVKSFYDNSTKSFL
jgi:hypothetical protein